MPWRLVLEKNSPFWNVCCLRCFWCRLAEERPSSWGLSENLTGEKTRLVKERSWFKATGETPLSSDGVSAVMPRGSQRRLFQQKPETPPQRGKERLKKRLGGASTAKTSQEGTCFIQLSATIHVTSTKYLPPNDAVYTTRISPWSLTFPAAAELSRRTIWCRTKVNPESSHLLYRGPLNPKFNLSNAAKLMLIGDGG